jgi:hypothetical protein
MDEEYVGEGMAQGRGGLGGKDSPQGRGDPGGSSPLGDTVPVPSTGDDRVDDAIAGLGRLHGTPAEDHVAILEEVHGRLRDILGELAEDSGTP